MELLLSRFPKIPFTCSYLPGAVKIVLLWPFYILGFACYGYAAAALESWLLAGNHRLLIFYVVAGAILFLLALRNGLAAGETLRFEEQSEDAPVLLDLRN